MKNGTAYRYPGKLSKVILYLFLKENSSNRQHCSKHTCGCRSSCGQHFSWLLLRINESSPDTVQNPQTWPWNSLCLRKSKHPEAQRKARPDFSKTRTCPNSICKFQQTNDKGEMESESHIWIL